MSAYRFSWDAFDDRTVAALAETYGRDPRLQTQTAREWLSARVKRPTPEFMRATKDVLVRTWLPTYVGTKHIVDRLIDAGIGPMRQQRSPAGYVNYVRDCRNSKSLRQYLLEAMLTFGDRDHAPGEEVTLEFTPRFVLLTPNKQPLDPRRPHGYQREAWDRLGAELARSRSTGIFQGLVVMPTGSGKTFTAVHWLLQHVVSAGGRVLWLAHRHELLSQAGAEFHKLAALAHPRKRLRVRIVSGAHCATTQVDPADDIVIASVASLARRREIARMLLHDEGRIVVIDEAHHAPARSYRDLMEELQARKTWRVLGLTATPTRTLEQQRPILAQLFGGRILYQVGLHELIERRILARPIPVIVATGAHVEAGVTDDDRAHYERFGELSEEWLDRIASYVERNELIVQHYLAPRRKYGPTLIFAINVRHAALLAEDLRERGVRADYVASYRPDGSDGEPMAVIRQFRDGQLDVLVNVQMVTEGVDVPGIQTVFLTRPTTSEILMRQMIGRALRGPAVGGSEHAYLVSFEDHWDKFRDWDSPFDLVPDIEAVADREAPEAAAVADVDRFQEHLPWDVIRATAMALRATSVEHKADAFEAVPDGWLVLERDDEDEGVRAPIAIYQHQRPCWDALVAHLSSVHGDALGGARVEVLYDEFFADCDVPAPSPHLVGMVVQHLARGGATPAYHALAGRRACDPHEIAKRIKHDDLRYREISGLIERSYTGLACAIYPSLREYRVAVEDALYELDHPDETTRPIRAIPVFEPRPDEQLTPGPAHDLEALMREVLATGAGLLGLPTLEFPGTLTWSRRILKGWYGMAYYREDPPRIRINRLLDSPDISVTTMRFLIWHEFLHVHLASGHTKTFRECERRWPGCVEAERELDNLNETFGVQYW